MTDYKRLAELLTDPDRVTITLTSAESRALRNALADVIGDPPSQMPTWRVGLRLPLTELLSRLKEEDPS